MRLILALFVSAFASSAFSFSIETRGFNGTDYQVVSVNPSKTELVLHWKVPRGNAYGTLEKLRSSLETSGKKFLFATNSGIYDTDFRPLGLHVERGKELRKLNRSGPGGGNFSMVPNGVFYLSDSKAGVVESSEYPVLKRRLKITFATQSGPLLLRRGQIHPKFSAGSANRKIRSGVGVNEKGEVIFAVSKGFVNFHDFASLFKNQLGCNDALYLDGTISEFLIGDTEAAPQIAPFVGVWSATEQASRPPKPGP